MSTWSLVPPSRHASSTSGHRMSFQVSCGCFLGLWRPLPYSILLNGPCASRLHTPWPAVAERWLTEGGANRAWIYPLSWLHVGMRPCLAELSGKKNWETMDLFLSSCCSPTNVRGGPDRKPMVLDSRQRQTKPLKLNWGWGERTRRQKWKAWVQTQTPWLASQWSSLRHNEWEFIKLYCQTLQAGHTGAYDFRP